MHGRLSFDTPWAVRPETLNSIARLMALGEDELRALAPRGEAPKVESGGGVAVIPLRGVITPRPSLMSLLFGGGGGLEGFRADLRGALASDDVGSILVDIDSPGGSTDLIAEAAAEIRAARRSKPITAIANTTAASAAYWLGSQANELVVTPSGSVGSIGVFAVHMDLSKAAEMEGVTPTLISAGAHKTDGHPLQPLSDEARENFQETVDGFYDMFVADVAKGRGVTPAAVRGGFGEGRMVTAKRAVDLGMADRVESFEKTVSRLVAGPERATRTAAALEAAVAAGTEVEAESSRADTPEQDPQQGDNPPPNSAPADEEAAARIAALVTARPHHVP